MDPYDRDMAEWCAAMLQKVRSSARRPDDELPELDRLVRDFAYHSAISRRGQTTWFMCFVEVWRRARTCTWAAWPLCVAWMNPKESTL